MKKMMCGIVIVAFSFLGCGPGTADQKQEAGAIQGGSIQWGQSKADRSSGCVSGRS
ncbi:MAG: hypothetical protein ACYSO0_02385 [Planctomycetota bacterium]